MPSFMVVSSWPGLVLQIQQLGRPLKEKAALLRQGQPPLAPDEQRHPQFLLQAPDLVAQGGWLMFSRSAARVIFSSCATVKK